MVTVLQIRADISWLKSELECELWLFYNWQKYAKKQYVAFQLESLVLRERWQVLRFANKGNFTVHLMKIHFIIASTQFAFLFKKPDQHVIRSMQSSAQKPSLELNLTE